MLIVVVSVFLIVEVPVAVTTILHVVLNTFEAFQDVRLTHQLNYIKLFTNFFIMLSYSVNFSIYCSMSKKFRETFKDLFVFGKRSRSNNQQLRQLLNEQEQQQYQQAHQSQYNKHTFEQQSEAPVASPIISSSLAPPAAPVSAGGAAGAAAAAATVAQAAAVGQSTQTPAASSDYLAKGASRKRNLLRYGNNQLGGRRANAQQGDLKQQECKL